jgi:hypothetical protein
MLPSANPRPPPIDRTHVLEGPDPFREVVRSQQDRALGKVAAPASREPVAGVTSPPAESNSRTEPASTVRVGAADARPEERVQRATRDYDALLDAYAQLQREMWDIKGPESEMLNRPAPPAYQGT